MGDEDHLMFVYGTLKQGFYNHRLMEDLIRRGECAYVGAFTTVEAFPLVCGPHGIPYLVNLPGSANRVRGELYSVSSGPGLARLDQLEGVDHGHYRRLPVAVEEASGTRVVNAEAYFAHEGFGEALWKRCGQVGLTEFTVDLGNKYVKREDRPPNYDFVQDIHTFISESH